MNEPVVGRFAPSPSGYMHLGNLLSMLLAWLDVRAQKGRLIFRMEDLDPARCRREYAEALAEDLRWLGLDWDEGWPDPAYAQSSRTELYREAFESLRERDLVYPCRCSRAERLAAASAPHPGERSADGSCRCYAHRNEPIPRGMPVAWKVHVPDRIVTVQDGHYGKFSQNLARDGGDFILRRRDGVYAYQLAVVIDDMAMGVTRVVRGRDLLSSAPRQAWLTAELGGTPPAYCHGPLLTAGEGKLSKRLGSLSTQVLRRESTPEAILGHLAFLCGLRDRDEPATANELLPDFSWDRVTRDDIAIG